MWITVARATFAKSHRAVACTRAHHDARLGLADATEATLERRCRRDRASAWDTVAPLGLLYLWWNPLEMRLADGRLDEARR